MKSNIKRSWGLSDQPIDAIVPDKEFHATYYDIDVIEDKNKLLVNLRDFLGKRILVVFPLDAIVQDIKGITK